MKLALRTCCWTLLLVAPLRAQAHPGRNVLEIRGHEQYVYFYPGAGNGPHRPVVFLPGDGGWRGFAVTMAENMAGWGYDVYGVDTRRYLMSFSGTGGLNEEQVAGDLRQFAALARTQNKDQVCLVGWSEGAGLSVVAASSPQNQSFFSGVIAVGLTERSILALRWKDLFSQAVKRDPNEPSLDTANYVGKVSPLPLYVIASTHDEYVSPEASRRLFAQARQPKQLVMIDAGNHRYDGAHDRLFQALQEGLQWIEQKAP